MRIVFVSTILHHAWGGADALWTAAAEAALSRGDQVLLVVSEIVAPHPRVAALVARGAAARVRPRGDRPPTLGAKTRRKLREILGRQEPWLKHVQAFRPDLVVLSGGGTYDPIMVAPLCAWLRDTHTPFRVIANFQAEHPFMDEPSRLLAREILGDAERLFFVSPRNLAVTRRHLLHPLPRAECIHGCMVHNTIVAGTPNDWPRGDVFRFASISRLEPMKGLDLLVHAFAAALADIPGWQLNIYGRGQQREYLADCARHSGIADRVRVHGFVDSLDEVWRENHLLVCSGIDEGVPITIPEAMLRGRAVFATRVGGADEWITPDRTGFLCPAPLVEFLAPSLRQAWDARDRWRTMGEAAAAFARVHYRPDDFLKIIRPFQGRPTV